ncbi:nicotinate-nucleotide--dimethylbenzimidazole phosphoribosyltransferase, partial [Piscinibacter sakaiensis]|uniref:nicotinate-nucleotide--dimethylbenzimidazole phosphoribosyltransferase n=1 Tax=Piscinibacter sakaiensis TaxID=1547922 RepID=UPI003729E183
QLLGGRLPLSAFAHQAGIGLSVVDCGVAEAVTPHARLVARKIAHGSRSVRLGPAMSVAQAHAGIRAGMELAEALPGNVLMCAGLGAGGFESGALVIARLAATDLRPLVQGGDASPADRVARLMVVLQTALERHRAATHPVEVLAALGGHEMSLMVGAMLVAASRRHLVVLDGMAACAAFHVATRLAPETRPYGLFCHSHGHPGLQRAQALLDGGPMLELGLNSQDGTGAVLACRRGAANGGPAAGGDGLTAAPDGRVGESASRRVGESASRRRRVTAPRPGSGRRRSSRWPRPGTARSAAPESGCPWRTACRAAARAG